MRLERGELGLKLGKLVGHRRGGGLGLELDEFLFGLGDYEGDFNQDGFVD